MSCHICGRSSCASWMHSLEEQERYASAIELFEKAEELREKIRNEEAEEEKEIGHAHTP
jgi:transcription elongation factor Elf1